MNGVGAINMGWFGWGAEEGFGIVLLILVALAVPYGNSRMQMLDGEYQLLD